MKLALRLAFALTAAVSPLALTVAAPAAAQAEDIVVGSYPATPNSWPFLIAMKQGFFQKAGADITGIITTGGGGQDIRNLVAGNLAFSETGVAPTISAIQQGVDVKIVGENVNGAGTVAWVSLPGSPVKTAKDLKGRKLAYTSPQSVTQGFAMWALNKLGYKEGDVTLVAAGGFPQSLTLLQNGGVNVAVISEPTITADGSKYNMVIPGWDSSIFPQMAATLSIAPARVLKERPQVVRGVIAGRKMAVDFMTNNRDEAAKIIATENKTDPILVRAMLDRLIDKGSADGVPAFGSGRIYRPAMENAVAMLRLVNAVQGAVDLDKMIDESALPESERNKK